MKFSKTPSTKLQLTNSILWRYITNSRDHWPLSKWLRRSLLQILQWNEQPSGMTIITSVPPWWLQYYVIPSGLLFLWRILALRVLPILMSQTKNGHLRGWLSWFLYGQPLDKFFWVVIQCNSTKNKDIVL